VRTVKIYTDAESRKYSDAFLNAVKYDKKTKKRGYRSIIDHKQPRFQ